MSARGVAAVVWTAVGARRQAVSVFVSRRVLAMLERLLLTTKPLLEFEQLMRWNDRTELR